MEEAAPLLPMQLLQFCATVIWGLYWLWLCEPFSTWITEWRGVSRRDLNITRGETDSAERWLLKWPCLLILRQ